MRNPGLDEAQAGIKIARRVSITSDRQMTPPLRSWHPIPPLNGKLMGKQGKQWQTLFLGAPKSLQMVTEP